MKLRRLQRSEVGLALALLWLALLGWLIWVHARASLQPPLYDAFAYFLKARALWSELSAGPLVNPLNLDPSIRPPGTVLMSYPFGFSTDFRGFYFRSIFFPIALVFAAVPLAIPRQHPLWRQPEQIWLAAAFLACAPFFYYFEPTVRTQIGVSFWGLVDGFLVGLAAMTGALISRSILSQGSAPASVAILLGLVMIFVKPSGAALAALDDAVVVIGWLWLAYQHRTDRALRLSLLRRALALAAFGAILSGGAVMLALHSRYLGTANMAYGKTSVAILKAESPLGWDALGFLVQRGIGPVQLLWLVLLLPLARLAKLRRHVPVHDRSSGFRVLAAILVVLTGLMSWLVFTGGSSQIRYFLPFLFFGLLLAVDRFIAAIVVLPARLKLSVNAVMAAVIANITLLLAFSNPSAAWQDATGVNVAAGQTPPGLAEGKALIAIDGASDHVVLVYSVDLGLSDADFGSTLSLAQIALPVRHFVVTQPVDWKRPSEFRVNDIGSTDYLFFVPLYDAHASEDSRVIDADLIWKEEYRIRLWASKLEKPDGVALISGDEHARLLKIIDRTRFRESLNAMVASYQWRPLFHRENQPTWWRQDAVRSRQAESPIRIDEVNFGELFKIQHADLIRNQDHSVSLNVWLDQAAAAGSGWIMLIHAIDASGKIVANFDRPVADLSSRTSPGDLEYQSVTMMLPAPATGVAVGFYQGSRLLMADRGQRDWGNKRVILRVPDTDAAH